jgi:hypothetical protein
MYLVIVRFSYILKDILSLFITEKMFKNSRDEDKIHKFT